MSARRESKLIDGRPIARQLLGGAKDKIDRIRDRTGQTPALATVLVGNDSASAAYARMKAKRCGEVGMKSLAVELPDSVSTAQLVAKIQELARDVAVHGIVLQHPVRGKADKRAAFEAIPLEKDVDGVSSAALGRLILGMPAFGACTPKGIMRLLAEYQVELDGAHAVVIGRSPILGRPMASMLINAHATVTLCHSRTRNLAEIVGQADVLIAAVGKPRFVQGDWIKTGAVVIDAGYNPGNVGDVDFDAAIERAALITPVPGGVGPLTVATLIDQTAAAAAAQLGVKL
jgi:methylenetetrahydrofolate dehydrogenase (NADP+)/methenyltetrahydrofolate cyclohydrolase